jgi:hypothetical protein
MVKYKVRIKTNEGPSSRWEPSQGFTLSKYISLSLLEHLQQWTVRTLERLVQKIDSYDPFYIMVRNHVMEMLRAFKIHPKVVPWKC